MESRAAPQARLAISVGYSEHHARYAAYSLMILGFYVWQPPVRHPVIITCLLCAQPSLGPVARRLGTCPRDDGDNRSLNWPPDWLRRRDCICYTVDALCPLILCAAPLWITVLC